MSLSQSLPLVSGGPMIGRHRPVAGLLAAPTPSKARYRPPRGTLGEARFDEACLGSTGKLLVSCRRSPGGQLRTLRSIQGWQMAEDPFGEKTRGKVSRPRRTRCHKQPQPECSGRNRSRPQNLAAIAVVAMAIWASSEVQG